MRGYDPAEVDRHVAELSRAAVGGAAAGRASSPARSTTLSQQAEEPSAGRDAAHGQAAAAGRADVPRLRQAHRPHPGHGRGGGRGDALGRRRRGRPQPGRGRGRGHRAREDGRQVRPRDPRVRRPARPPASSRTPSAAPTRWSTRPSARRSPAAARPRPLYEEQRARAAKAAADFEKTLAERRDKAEEIFQDRTEEAERELDEARDRVAKMRAAGRPAPGRGRSAARPQLTGRVRAEGRADRGRGHGPRRPHPRASPSASSPPHVQRRNAINAQLTNVRQMLATLSGTSAAAVAEAPGERTEAVTDRRGAGRAAQHRRLGELEPGLLGLLALGDDGRAARRRARRPCA